jgi:hypothetical protein
MEDLVCYIHNHTHHRTANAHYLWTGELEKTIFERICMIQRIRGLISSREDLGHRLKPFVDQLDNYLNPVIKGTVFEDLTPATEALQGEECSLETNILQHLHGLFVRTGKACPPLSSSFGYIQGTATMYAKARQHNKFNRHGVIFSPSSFSVRDSNVVIGKEIPGNWCAGQIKQIFTFPFAPPSEVYFVVQRFKELSAQEASQDPYRRYPLVGGRLYRPELEDEIEVVTLQEILAHFAHTPHDKETFGFPCFHALPLNKVPCRSPLQVGP